MSRPPPPITPGLDDEKAERVRREHERAIMNLQQLPAVALKVLSNVQLADGKATPVAHGLGRVPTFATFSFPRGAASTGRIDEVRDGSLDRSRYLILKATGWGATITIDVAVM